MHPSTPARQADDAVTETPRLRSDAVTETLRLRSDAASEITADGVTALVEGHIRAPLGTLGPALAGAVSALAGGASESELVALTTAAEGEMAQFKLRMLLGRLERGGWLQRTVSVNGQALATLQPVGHAVPPQAPPANLSEPLVLSRFAIVRAENGTLRAESPLHSFYVQLHEPSLATLLGRLSRPTTADELADAVPGLAPHALRPLLGLLRDAAIIVADGAQSPPGLAQWSCSDLLFHARSRVGRHLGGFGRIAAGDGLAEALPAVKPPLPVAVALPQPDLGALERSDPPFAAVVARRHSVRTHDDANPITVAELGELLYRVARVAPVARVRNDAPDGDRAISRRPYPSSGGRYELEIYPLINLCAGVEPGLYHYDPSGHALGRVAEPGPPLTLLAEYSRITAAMAGPPQVVLLLTARFGRVMHSYESIAYALVLKHVGVLYQSLYLTAAAMDLGPCALEGGNSDAFCAAAGTDYYEETTVGEFVLGRPA